MSVLRLVPLGSGSPGNATLVEIGETRVLVDAGLSAKRLALYLDEIGVPPSSVHGVLLSHEHQDHARGAERFSRRHGVPVISAWETLEALDLSPSHLEGWRPIEPGEPFEIGEVKVDPFSVPHDAARPMGFVLEGEGLKVAVATDLGQATTVVAQRLRGCDVLMIESNHDETMLRDGPYPWQIKQRVAGRLGHLSNEEAAALVEYTAHDNCRFVVLAHLSEHNNRPDLARKAVSRVLRRSGRGHVDVLVAETRGPTTPIVLEHSP